MSFNLKKIKFNVWLYPFLLVLVLLILLAVSFFSIKYLSAVTNRVLVSSDTASGDLIKLDLDDYNTVATKIGLPLVVVTTADSDIDSGIITDAYTPESVVASSTDFSTTTISSTAIVSTTIDKQNVKIAVYNGTSKAGLAADLRDQLTAIGFVNINIGSVVTSTTGTVIGVKESVASIYPEIATEISKTYTNVVRQILAEDFDYDVWIIIGR
jgi:hypothetical protein